MKKHLYNEIHKRNPEISPKLAEAYLSYMTLNIKKWVLEPDNLILRVDNLGDFAWRKRKIEKYKAIKAKYTEEQYRRHGEYRLFLTFADKILGWYSDYLQEKKENSNINEENKKLFDDYYEVIGQSKEILIQKKIDKAAKGY